MPLDRAYWKIQNTMVDTSPLDKRYCKMYDSVAICEVFGSKILQNMRFNSKRDSFE